MQIAFQRCNKDVDDYIVNSLKDAGIQVLSFEKDELVSLLSYYCESETIPSEYSALTGIVLQIDDKKMAEEIILILSSSMVYRRPRVLLLSSLMTWAGKKQNEGVIDGNFTNFNSRVPAVCASDQYLLENKFAHMVSSTKMDGCIVGLGLLYGGEGLDFQDMYMSLWSKTADETTTILSLTDGQSSVPMIHIYDFTKLLSSLIAFEGRLPTFYVAATDNARMSVSDLCHTIAKVTHRQVNLTSYSEGLQVLMTKPNMQIWCCNIPVFRNHAAIFQAAAELFKYADGLCANFPKIWKEWLKTHNLSVCSILVTGPPKCMKSDVAKLVAARLQLKYLDVNTCLKFVIEETGRAETAKDRASAKTPLDHIHVLRTRLLKALDSQRAATPSSHSKGKGKGDESGGEKASHSSLTEAACRGVPAQLVRLCIGAVITTDPVCVRHGYVLDVWDWAVQSADDLRQVLTHRDEGNNVDLGDDRHGSRGHQSAPSSSMAHSRPPSTDSSSVAVDPAADLSEENSLPELVLELQSTDEASSSRFLASLLNLPVGTSAPSKLTKDQQASVKSFDTLQAQYKSLMIPISSEDSKLSHTGVLDLEKKGLAKILRLDTASSTAEMVADSLVVTFKEHHGGIGWLDVITSDEKQFIPTDGDSDAGKTSEEGLEESEDDQFFVQEELLDARQSATSLASHAKSRIAGLNANLSELEANDRKSVVTHCEELQKYLLDNVLPHIADGMIRVARDRPDDPIAVMIQFLHQRATKVEEDARSSALSKFNEALSLAEQIDRELQHGK